MRSHWAGIVYLSITTMLWGTTFVFVKTSLDTLQTSQITLFRFGLAVLCFLPWILRARGKVWGAGLELGFYSWVSYATQVHGLSYTMVGRSFRQPSRRSCLASSRSMPPCWPISSWGNAWAFKA